MTAYAFPVEASHVLMFARAVGMDDAPYVDSLRGESSPRIPPTFLRARVHFRPTPATRTRRPVLHAEQSFSYYEPVCVGDFLEVKESAGATWEKPRSAGGALRFEETIVTYRRAGRVVAVERSIGTVPLDEPTGATIGDPPTTGAAVELGQAHEEVALEPTTRVAIARYAGASGDFAGLHVDETFATESAGFPTVIAHGMLTMGVSITAVLSERRATAEGVACRFRRPVLPNQTLVVRHGPAVRTREDESFPVVAFETLDDAGTVVASGSVVLSGPGAGR